MCRQRLFQWILPVVILVGLAAATSAPADPENSRGVAKQRIKWPRKEKKTIRAMTKAGEGESSEQVRRWSRRLMEAEMGMSEKKADQIAAINADLLRMKDLQKRTDEGYRNREVGYLELFDAEWYVLDAKSLLSQAEAE